MLVFALLWLALFLLTGEQFLGVRLVSYLAPWVSVTLLVYGMVCLLLKYRILAVAAIFTGGLIFLPYAKQFIPTNATIPNDRAVYKIMTYSKMGRNKDINAIAKVINSEKPDILVMQEIDYDDAYYLLKLLESAYKQPLSIEHSHYGIVLSRFPTNNQLKGAKRFNQSVLVSLPETEVIVKNVHLQKSFRSTSIQYEMVKSLAEQVKNEDRPLIVAGDFNATMVNYPYVIIGQYLDNAFERAGFGFGFTFPSANRRLGKITPFMRIDHIFYSRHFVAYDAWVSNDAGSSDHFPVVALLSFKSLN